MDVFQTDVPLHLFHHGENFQTYKLMGAHAATVHNKKGYVFRVWAPRAKSVSVIGNFNEWNESANMMERLIDGQTFETFIPGVKQFDEYKFCIKTNDGRTLYKADPYAFHAETPGVEKSNASKIYNVDGFKWTDKEYLDKQTHSNIYAQPVNIYEVNLLSWRKNEDGSYYTYRQLAKELVSYVKKMG